MRFSVLTAASATADVACIADSICSLESMPERRPVAPEARKWEGPVIRQLLAGQYRILFTVEDQVVVVLRVRHAQRSAMSAEELLAVLRGGLELVE